MSASEQLSDVYDEVFNAHGACRPHAEALITELERLGPSGSSRPASCAMRSSCARASHST